jgi:hypothetical protein
MLRFLLAASRPLAAHSNIAAKHVNT